MKLNYTQRLMFYVGGCTFILTTCIFFIVWLVIEQAELDEEQQLPEQFGQIIDRLLDPSLDNSYISLPEGIELYLSTSDLPDRYREFKQPGHHALGDGKHLLVRLHPVNQAPYYIVYEKRGMLDEIAEDHYELGITLLGVICASIAAIVFVNLLVRRLAAPVLLLKDCVDKYDGASSDFPLLKRDDEIGALSKSFHDLIVRMRSFAQREREFTRFASHELRSPVMVMRGNIDLLAQTLPATDQNLRIMSRSETAVKRMTQLINTFLWLGREDQNISPSPMDAAGLSKLISELLDSYPRSEHGRIRSDIGEIDWLVDGFMLSVLLDNLIRNAINHGQRDVEIVAQGPSLWVKNRVVSESSPNEMGIGLDIVSRICEANNWQHQITMVDSQFVVLIRFNGEKDIYADESTSGC